MYFKLHDNFFRVIPPKVFTVHVVWYDGQAGSGWRLVYDAGGPTMKTALAITGSGDKQWHDATVTLTDAAMKHGGPKGSDLALVNADEKDDVFSIVEIHRGKGIPQWMPAGSQPANQPNQQSRASKREERPKAKGKRRHGSWPGRPTGGLPLLPVHDRPRPLAS